MRGAWRYPSELYMSIKKIDNTAVKIQIVGSFRANCLKRCSGANLKDPQGLGTACNTAAKCKFERYMLDIITNAKERSRWTAFVCTKYGNIQDELQLPVHDIFAAE